MTPSLKCMNTGRLVNTFEKGSLQKAQKCTQLVFTEGQYFGYLEKSGICKEHTTGQTGPASLSNQNPTFTDFLHLETEEKIIPFILSYFQR